MEGEGRENITGGRRAARCRRNHLPSSFLPAAEEAAVTIELAVPAPDKACIDICKSLCQDSGDVEFDETGQLMAACWFDLRAESADRDSLPLGLSSWVPPLRRKTLSPHV